jgi:large subunit ribosomal protein L23
MALWDKFKFNKGPKKSDKAKPKAENVLDMVKDEKPVEAKKPQRLKEATGDAFRHLIRPQLSEKANMLAAKGKYVFRVHPDANKPEVRKAIEKVYDVHVKQVNIIRVRGKSRRYGHSTGSTKAWKKAVITVAAGERIEGVTETV